MKRTLKRVALGSMTAIALGLVVVFALSEREAAADYSAIAGHPLILPAEASEIAEGGRLVEIFHCTDCHGDDMGGGPMVDEWFIDMKWRDEIMESRTSTTPRTGSAPFGTGCVRTAAPCWSCHPRTSGSSPTRISVAWSPICGRFPPWTDAHSSDAWAR